MTEPQSEIKILLVDDREENLLTLETILKNDYYTLVKANSGKEALKRLLEDQDYYLIIMDVIMPGMDGFETAELIYQRQKLKNIPIIFLTAMDIEGNIYRGYQAGAIDYISKPVQPDLLKVKVRAFVDLSIKNKKLIDQEMKLRATNLRLEREIREKHRSEKKVKSLNEDLARKLEELQSLDAFAYSVSHDLMSPLNNINGLANLLYNHHGAKFDKEVLKILELMLDGSKKMSTLIKDLLLFSRQANAELIKDEFDMNEMVQCVLEEIAVHTDVERINIKVHKLPIAYCDGNMLKQVWINFISNAIKYSQKKERPEIEVGASKQNGSHVYYVRDNGAGFDMNNYDKLFGAFQRLHNAREFAGTGIGLAIVKRIVERHGGKVWAESVVNEGSTFYFLL